MDKLDLTKKLIEDQVTRGSAYICGGRFEGIQKVYFTTNENISGYIDEAELNSSSKCLSVLASGDHVFNLIMKGSKDIDTFDLNTLSEYFALGIRRAMILKYSYLEYIEINNRIKNVQLSLDETSDLINDLLPFMEKNHRSFWQEIMNYNYKLQKGNENFVGLFQMLCLGINSKIDWTLSNPYLHNEASYNTLKVNLQDAHIRFKNISVLDIPEVYSKYLYDAILLSNILDYIPLNLEKLTSYVKSLERIMKPESVIFLKYIVLYADYRNNLFTESPDSSLKKENLTDFDIIDFPRTDGKKVHDGMILKRIK